MIVSAKGPWTGKPRPAVVVQSDTWNETHGSVTIVPMTSVLLPAPLFRVEVEPDPGTGLQVRSQAQVDKLVTVRREALSEPIGGLDEAAMWRVDEALRRWLGL